MSIGENIKTLRKRKKLTQQSLADKAGLNIGTIQGYEQGKYEPKKDALFKLQKALDCNINEILDAPWPDGDEITEENAIFLSLDELNLVSKYKLNLQDFVEFKTQLTKTITDGQQELLNLTEEPIISAYRKLNKEGQKKVVEYATDLSLNPRYKKD